MRWRYAKFDGLIWSEGMSALQGCGELMGRADVGNFAADHPALGAKRLQTARSKRDIVPSLHRTAKIYRPAADGAGSAMLLSVAVAI